MSFLIALSETPNENDLSSISDNLTAFNVGDVGPADRRPLTITVKKPDGELIAGISASTAWGWLFIQLLWVDEAARGQGLAGKMLDVAEAEAAKRGCHGAYIDTFNPVALTAYERAGYQEFGRLEDFPKGRTRVWLRKMLTK